MYVLLFLLSLS